MSDELKDLIAAKVMIAITEACKHTGKKVDESDEEDEDEDDETVEEMSRRRAAVIGALVGGPAGAMIGAQLAKGKQRTLDDQIRSAEKKIQAWSKDPSNKEKVNKKREQIAKWKKELIELKQNGKGESGSLRTKMADVDRGRESAAKMEKSK